MTRSIVADWHALESEWSVRSIDGVRDALVDSKLISRASLELLGEG